MKKLHLLAMCVVSFLFLSQESSASIVIVEPDLFSDGTDISTAFPGVTLSAVGGTVGSQVISYDIVDPCCPNAPPPPTGMSIFGHNGANYSVWKPSHPNDPTVFRADFSVGVAYVSIDTVQLPPGSGGYSLGTLFAFDMNNNQLESISFIALGEDMVTTAVINHSLSDISYITVASNTDMILDNLRYSVSSIPIPPSFLLFGSGLLGLIGIARKKTSA